MKLEQKLVLPALASCVFLGLAACSSASSSGSSASSASSPACSAMINALSPYAAEKFSQDKAELWANQVVNVTGPQIITLSRKEQSSSDDPSAAEKKLLSDENTLYNDATGLEDDARPQNKSGNVSGDMSSVTKDIKIVYADCGQSMP